MSLLIYIEGGGDTKKLRRSCCKAFRSLFEQCDFSIGRLKLVAAGPRSRAFDKFCTAHAAKAADDFVALLVDSEDPVTEIEKPWRHLEQRKEDKWNRPDGATDEQVFLMVTSMETWIVADRDTLREHYGKEYRESKLPSANDLELLNRKEVLDALVAASKDCSETYDKGRNSFRLLAKVDASVLKRELPSFNRMVRILDQKLRPQS